MVEEDDGAILKIYSILTRACAAKNAGQQAIKIILDY